MGEERRKTTELQVETYFKFLWWMTPLVDDSLGEGPRWWMTPLVEDSVDG